MSFGKNLFVFVSGAVVGAAGMTAFAGYKAFKMLKKNEVLYSAVEASVKAGMESASSEMSNRVAKMVTNFIFGNEERKPRFGDRVEYENYHDHSLKKWNNVVFKTKAEAQSARGSMLNLAESNGCVTVIDLHDINGDYTDTLFPYKHYGWTFTDIYTTRIIKNGDGTWIIDLPNPRYLEEK